MFTVHVITVGNTEIMIEALAGRHKIRVISEVPFPDTHGRVILLLQDFGDGDFIRIETLTRRRKEHTKILFIDMHVDSARITAGHEAGTRRGADGAGRIKVSEPHAFPGHLVKDGRGVLLGSEGPDVGIAKVIAEDDNDVRFPFGGLNERSRNQEGKERQKIDGFHRHWEVRNIRTKVGEGRWQAILRHQLPRFSWRCSFPGFGVSGLKCHEATLIPRQARIREAAISAVITPGARNHSPS